MKIKIMSGLALAAMLATATTAQEAKTPGQGAVEAERSVDVKLTLQDVQVGIISIVNAGTACDAGVQTYCQLVAARTDTLKKLQEAFGRLQAQGKKP